MEEVIEEEMWGRRGRSREKRKEERIYGKS